MNKILLIIQREYLTRVKKKSFLLMTIIGPLLMAALVIVPSWLENMTHDEERQIGIVEETPLFQSVIPNTDDLKFDYLKDMKLPAAKELLKNDAYYAVLYIPENVINSKQVQIFSKKDPSMGLKSHVAGFIEKEIERQKLRAENIDEDILHRVKTRINVQAIKFNKKGEEEESFRGIKMVLGFVSGFLIYMFIFMYGAQVMRGVIEEKTSRIVEVIVSSVKPFQLMMGKIVGVAMVGLTQFVLWVVLTFTIITAAQSIMMPDKPFTADKAITENVLGKSTETIQQLQPEMEEEIADMTEIKTIFTSIRQINFGVVIGSFLFFFLAGYLLYAALFAAIGSAVDSEADTQQFMLPITIPLILGMVMLSTVIENPDSTVAFWFSIIPFTSPIVMMARIPFGVPFSELFLSMAVLILTFVFMTWVAGKIYRTGILMYGKKISYKEIWKWLKYKN